jgi:hypothetical protein|eukprot:COSAG01_NODE_983_length_12354_cov_2.780335_11_plen_476_part_00
MPRASESPVQSAILVEPLMREAAREQQAATDACTSSTPIANNQRRVSAVTKRLCAAAVLLGVVGIVALCVHVAAHHHAADNNAAGEPNADATTDDPLVLALAPIESEYAQWMKYEERGELGHLQNESFMLSSIRGAQRSEALQYASADLRADPDLVYSAVTYSGMALAYAVPAKSGTPGPRGDKRVVTAAVHQNGMALQYAGTTPEGINLRSDPDVVYTAVTNNGMALAYAISQVHVRSVSSSPGHCSCADQRYARYAPTCQAQSSSVGCHSYARYQCKWVSSPPPPKPPLSCRSSASRYTANCLTQTTQSSCLSWKSRYGCIWVAPPPPPPPPPHGPPPPSAPRGDKRVVTAAVHQNGMALQYAGTTPEGINLRSDPDVVYTAVTNNGMALAYAVPAKSGTPGPRGDKRVVLAAVTNNGMALQYAGTTPQGVNLRSDRDCVLAAVTNNGRAIAYASPELRSDKSLMLAAVSGNV